MSDGKKYQDYLKKYDAHFLNTYQSWSHDTWGRRSNYLQLLYFRCYSLFTGRNILMAHLRLKTPYIFVCTMVCLADVYGVWYFQDVYQKYMPWKQTMYQPWMKQEDGNGEDLYNSDTFEEKKPTTRLKYADAIKIVYDGKEDQESTTYRRLRYR